MNDYHRGALSLRRIFTLVRGLPPHETALARAKHGVVAASWRPLEYLTALVADHLAVANWQRGSGDAASYPKPVTRPGDVRSIDNRDAPERVEAREAYEASMARPDVEED